MEKKRFLVTGATGFCAPHLINKLLDEGHTVLALTRRTCGSETDIIDIVGNRFDKIKWVFGDLVKAHTLNKIFQAEQIDGIFALGAQSHPPTSFLDPVGTMETNIMGMVNLIQAITENQPEAKLHFCSTSEVYGNSIKEGECIDETFPIFPSNPYGVSKASIDLYVQERTKNNKLKGFITRSFSHTGARRAHIFSISSDAKQIAAIALGKQEKVLKVGNLDSIRVVLDVRDISNAYYLLMMSNQSNGEIYNICGDTPRAMGEYTDMLIKLSGVDDIIKEVCPKLYRPVDIHYQFSKSEKIKSHTGWFPKYSIEETMESLYNYWIKKLS